MRQPVWLYCRVPPSWRMAEAMLAARGIIVSDEPIIPQWALKFGQNFASQIRRVLDVLVRSWRATSAAQRLLCKSRQRQCRAPRVLVADRRPSYGAAKRAVMSGVEHRRHKGLTSRAERSPQPTQRRERPR